MTEESRTIDGEKWQFTPSPRMSPHVGATVHYVSYGTPPREDGSQAYGSRCRAAIVTERTGWAVDPATQDEGTDFVAGLCVLNPEGLFFNRGVVHQAAGDGGTWHWAGEPACARHRGEGDV